MLRSVTLLLSYGNTLTGKVTYDCDTFIDKNKDYIVPEHTSLMQQAKSGFVKALFQNMATAAKSDKSGKTDLCAAGSQFRSNTL